MTEGWVDEAGDWIEPDKLSPLNEILARLKSYHRGILREFVQPAERWEQGQKPVALTVEDRDLVNDLLALPVDCASVESALRSVGAARVRTVLRAVLIEWSPPEQVQEVVWLDLPRQKEGVLWLLEKVEVGVTGVRVQVSISSPLPDNTSSHVFYPSPPPYEEEPERLEPWWSRFWETRLTDNLGTPYEVILSEGGAQGFPVRVLAADRWQTRVAERYSLTYFPGVPAAAGSLTLSGAVDLEIEQPLTESPPWPKREVVFGDFAYTVDLTGWGPAVIKDAPLS